MRRNRHQRNRNNHPTSLDGLQSGDNVGNRKTFREVRVPADDIGNRSESIQRFEFVRDDIGNSVHEAPTHLQSGVLVGIDGKARKPKDAMHQRMGRYVVGGVNPLVAGNPGLITTEEPPSPRPQAQKAGPQAQTHNKPDQKADGNERWLRKLLEFDEDERSEFTLKSDPVQKADQAKQALAEILTRGGLLAQVDAQVLTEKNVPVLKLHFEESQASRVFVEGKLEMIALNFLVNKIVNRYPDDRIRLSVLPTLKAQPSKEEPSA